MVYTPDKNGKCVCPDCLSLSEGPALNVRRCPLPSCAADRPCTLSDCRYFIDPIAVRDVAKRSRPPNELPSDSKQRKDTPVYSGVLAYFPLALAAVAQLSKVGNDKHNPGTPLHWSKDKSNDHADCIARHLLELGTVDPDDGFLHDVKLAWRALANLQIRLEGGK